MYTKQQITELCTEIEEGKDSIMPHRSLLHKAVEVIRQLQKESAAKGMEKMGFTHESR